MELDGDVSNLACDSAEEEAEEASDDDAGGDSGADPVPGQSSGAAASAGHGGRGGHGPAAKAKAAAAKDKAKAQAKSRATGKRHAAKQPREHAEDWKKCNCCKKFLDRDQFHEDQARCKKCSSTLRSIAALAKSQNFTAELEKMKQVDIKQYEALLRSFSKTREEASRLSQKIKFSLVTFREEYKSRSGVMNNAEAEMMWEGEYFEYAKTAKAGFLSEAEMKANWQAWLADPEHPRDNDGPRGFLRLAVRTKDKIVDYSDMSKERTLSREEKMAKNSTHEQLKAKLTQVYAETGAKEHDFAEWSDLKRKAHLTFAANSGAKAAAAFDAEGLMAPDLSDLVAEVARKRRRKGDQDESDDDEKEAEDEEEAAGDSREEGDKVGKQTWFDAETRTNKAERTFVKQTELLKATMTNMLENMQTEATTTSRNAKEAAAFGTELQVVTPAASVAQCSAQRQPREFACPP